MKKLCLSLFYSSLFPTYLSILVDDFYPFGNENGDSRLPKDDEIFSESIEFPFFNVDRHNGFVSIFYYFFRLHDQTYLDVLEYNSKGLDVCNYF